MAEARIFSQCAGFEWDKHAALKKWGEHRVAPQECEGVLFNSPLVVGSDLKHSAGEPRYYCLGGTDAGRMLYLVFTVRGSLIRVISARDVNRKEKEVYRS
jgi:uncharacterized DUF497 family protein